MITDAIMGAVVALFEGILSALPEMPARPEAFDAVWTWMSMGLSILPVQELAGFGPAFVATLGLLVVVRLIRAFLPGG